MFVEINPDETALDERMLVNIRNVSYVDGNADGTVHITIGEDGWYKLNISLDNLKAQLDAAGLMLKMP